MPALFETSRPNSSRNTLSPLPEITRGIFLTRESASSIWSALRANTAPLAPVTPTTIIFLLAGFFMALDFRDALNFHDAINFHDEKTRRTASTAMLDGVLREVKEVRTPAHA